MTNGQNRMSCTWINFLSILNHSKIPQISEEFVVFTQWSKINKYSYFVQNTFLISFQHGIAQLTGTFWCICQHFVLLRKIYKTIKRTPKVEKCRGNEIDTFFYLPSRLEKKVDFSLTMMIGLRSISFYHLALAGHPWSLGSVMTGSILRHSANSITTIFIKGFKVWPWLKLS